MKIEIKLDKRAIRNIENAVQKSALEAMGQLRNDLINSQTMPFDAGDMQNNQTFVEPTENGAVLITDSPQARRLYYHPEYNFQQGKNSNAGALWLEPYISGDKKDFVKQEYIKALKGRLNK